ncbi:MAG: hypothetical protein WC852_00160 [Candidatus Nanoarchaeia archaeon]|jgi:hypothetical protein
MPKTIEDKYFYPIIIILISYIIFRLIDQAKIMTIFPFDYANDASCFMTLLHFLAKYGFHNIAPEWYGGLVVLKFYSPGWFFFTLPLYWITKNVQIASYISMIVLYLLSAIFIAIIGKYLQWSIIKRIAFFALFFGNPISIGNFIRLGSYPHFFAWVFFIPFLGIILWYINHKIDNKFYLLFIPIFAIMILSHPQETLLAGIMLASFVLISKEKIKILISSIITVILTSFWWYPFLKDYSQSTIYEYALTSESLSFRSEWAWTNIAAVIISIALIFLFYIYWKSTEQNYKTKFFFLPVILMAVLLITKLVIFIPYLNQVYVDSFLLLFLMCIIYFLFNIDVNRINRLMKYGILGILIIFPVVSVTLSHIHTPYFKENSPLAKDIMLLLPQIKGTYLFLGVPPKDAYLRAFYSYGAIYLNLSTANGWTTHEVSIEKQELLVAAADTFNNNNCTGLLNVLKKLNVTEIVSYKESCTNLQKCGLKAKGKRNDTCLLTTA